MPQESKDVQTQVEIVSQLASEVLDECRRLKNGEASGLYIKGKAYQREWNKLHAMRNPPKKEQ